MARMITILPISAALAALLMAGPAAGAPDLQEPHRACLQTSVGGHEWYYDIHTDVSGTTLDRWAVSGGSAAYVDRNGYAAFHLPEGDRSTWDEGVAFAATMQTRQAWLNSEPTNTATWVYDGDAGEDTMTWKTTVNGAPRDFVFRTSYCQDLTAPHSPVPEPPATDAPTEGQQPDTPAPVWRACLEASSRGVTYYYEVHSDASNDAAGTTFDRYKVAGGVDTFVDSNAFAALRQPDGDLPWSQGIQFADAMQARGVWMNAEPTTAASIEHDADSGEHTLTFKTKVNGGAQDYVFRTSYCRGADVPTEPQVPDTDAPNCKHCQTDAPTDAPCYTDAPTEPQVPDTEEPCYTDAPTEPQVPDTEEPCYTDAPAKDH